ncbi:hypothetical protein ACFQU9_20640 [Actinomadura namibiensis]|uniref:Uncharacterized protein n=1 Tax=Actinomadura namibiensis TaxID=182080 RepID=A0A7W3QMN0_ACTNM|nr:hypothetical protein [Actinomadura namibiensis]MBA8952676.1 hypothetical protein [Actinomadura namibiensis]
MGVASNPSAANRRVAARMIRSLSSSPRRIRDHSIASSDLALSSGHRQGFRPNWETKDGRLIDSSPVTSIVKF